MAAARWDLPQGAPGSANIHPIPTGSIMHPVSRALIARARTAKNRTGVICTRRLMEVVVLL
jgi:hypothetical protein